MVVPASLDTWVVEAGGIFEVWGKAGERGCVADFATAVDLDADLVCAGVDLAGWDGECLRVLEFGRLDFQNRIVVDEEDDVEVIAGAFAAVKIFCQGSDRRAERAFGSESCRLAEQVVGDLGGGSGIATKFGIRPESERGGARIVLENCMAGIRFPAGVLDEFGVKDLEQVFGEGRTIHADEGGRHVGERGLAEALAIAVEAVGR